MSHNATLSTAPHVVSQTPTAFFAVGSTTVTINGNNLSPTCKLKIPAALGTVVSGPVITNSTSTTSDATWTLNINAIPDPAVSHTPTLTNGGLESTGVTLSMYHGWHPSAIMINPADTYLQASDASGVGNGNPTGSITPGTGNRGALTQTTGNQQPVYYDSIARLNNKPGLTLGSVTWYTNGLFSNTNWQIDIPSTLFTFAVCWAPSTSGTPLFGSKLYDGKSWLIYMNDNGNQFRFVQTGGGTAYPDTTYPNINTTTPRRLILSSNTTAAWTMVEPTTGIDIFGTAGTSAPGSYNGRTTLNGLDIHIAEMILVTGRELTTADKNNLNTYWLTKYG